MCMCILHIFVHVNCRRRGMCEKLLLLVYTWTFFMNYTIRRGCNCCNSRSMACAYYSTHAMQVEFTARSRRIVRIRVFQYCARDRLATAALCEIIERAGVRRRVVAYCSVV